jgi:predicted MFS family arabinose efflux permease
MSTAETRAVDFSRLAMGYSVSSFLGPVIAGYVIDHANHAIAYAVFTGFVLVSLMLMFSNNLNRVNIARRSNQQRSGSVLDLLRDREMRRIYLISILLGSAWDLFNFVMPIYGSSLGFSASTIGLILACFAAASFAIRFAMHWIARRFSEWQVLITALSLAVICYALLPFMKDVLSLMVIAAALGLALGSSQPNVLALLHHASPMGRAGEAVGIRVTISNACQVALPLAFGAAGATMGLFTVFWGMGAMIGTGVPLVWRKAFGN